MWLVIGPGQEDVARLDVAMDEALGVRGIECGGQGDQDPDGQGDGKCAAPSQKVRKVVPFDVPHGDEQAAIDLAGLVDRNDVRVVKRGRGARLDDEPVAECLVLGELW